MSSIHLTKEASAKLAGLPVELYSDEYKQLCAERDAAWAAYEAAQIKVYDFESQANRNMWERRAITNPDTFKQMGVEL